jgi:hypothetical protein
MANFPTKGAGGLSQAESPSLYERDRIDNVAKGESEGGYEFRRPRSTRARRKVISTGFIGLPHADYLVLDGFWETHGTHTVFTYTDYLHGTQHQVRFDEFKPDYVGVGTHRRWTIKIKMSEV